MMTSSSSIQPSVLCFSPSESCASKRNLEKPPIGVKGRDHHGRRASALEVAVELDDEGEGAGHGGEEGGDEEEEEEFSVHMRMFSYPQGDNW